MEIQKILDTENKIWLLPAFISNWFVKKYDSQGMIQIDTGEGELCICGDAVRWLDRLSVRTTSEKRATKLMFEFLNNKYPQYKPYIQLF